MELAHGELPGVEKEMKLPKSELKVVVEDKVISFSGSRYGLTDPQTRMLRYLIHQVPKEAMHGDCVGADEVFHNMIRELDEKVHITAYPSNLERWRAFCVADKIQKARDPLERDRLMVMLSEMLIACPKSRRRNRSGTWYTIDYALSRNVLVLLIPPNGKVKLLVEPKP